MSGKKRASKRPKFTRIIAQNMETYNNYMERFLNGEEFSSTPPDCKGGSLRKHKQVGRLKKADKRG